MADIKSHSTLPTSLVSYWDLEEASGTRYDLHGSNDLTENGTGGVGQAAGKTYGNAADLEDGDDDYLENSGACKFTGDVSFNFWLKMESLPTAQRNIVSRFLATGNHRSYIWYLINNGSDLDIHWYASSDGTGATVVDNSVTWSTPSTATWYMLTLTFDASAGTAKAYVDGSQVGTDMTGFNTSIHSGNAVFDIGTISSITSKGVDGLYDEFGAWQKVLTTDEITDLYNGGSGLPYYDPADIKNDSGLGSANLVSYWELEEAADATRVDSHGSNDLEEAAGKSISAGTGILGNGADFELSNSDDMFIADNASLSITGNISVSAWVKVEAFVGSEVGMQVVSKYLTTGNQRSYRLWLWEKTGAPGAMNVVLNYSTDGSVANSYTTDSAVIASTGTWYHIVATVEVGTETCTIYINGVVAANTKAGTAGTSIYDGSSTFRIGGITPQSEYMDGLIDEFAIYNDVLTVDEVRALYGYGTPPQYAAAASTFVPKLMMF